MKIRMRPHKRNGTAGFSTAEAVFALAVGMVAIAGGMAVSEQELRIVKSSRESNAASLTMEERLEQLRIANWRQITDPDYISGTYFATRPRSVAALPGVTETLKVTAYPDPTASAALIVERKDGGSAVVLTSGEGMSEQRLAKVCVQVRWAGKDSRVRVRELATIISNAGISRMNLPAMGGGTSENGSSTEPGADTGDGSGTTSTLPDGSGTTTGTGSTNNGNGNGNGQGNVGGKSGKK